MNKRDNSIDEKIKAYASAQIVNLPDEYEKMIEDRVNQCLNGEQKMRIKMPKVAVAALVFALLFGGMGGVYAARNYLYERQSMITQEEQDNYRNELSESDADADHYSRPITKAERKRMEVLHNEYINQGHFPQESLVRIVSEKEVDSSRICFLADTSTFYLPDELTDEDLLELIDFYYIRNYSLETNSNQMQTELEVKSEIGKEEAITLAEKKIESVFGIDIQNAEISQEYLKGESEQGIFSKLNVCVSVNDLTYGAAVDLQTGSIYELSVDSEESNYASGIAADTEWYNEMSAAAEELAKKFVADGDFIRREMEFAINEHQELDTGIVNYIFMTDDGHVCVVGYSCATERFYLIRYFTYEAFETRCEQKDKINAKRGYTNINICY